MRNFAHIERALGGVWAVRPTTLRLMQDLVARAAENPSGWIAPEFEPTSQGPQWTTAFPNEPDDPKKRPQLRLIDEVPAIPVFGVLTPFATMFDNISGMTSYERTVRLIGDAFALKPKAVLFEIDSPGGAVAGLEEAALAMLELTKAGIQTIAFVNHAAHSAAYYIASQASRVVASPSSEVGSIGTIIAGYVNFRALRDAGADPVVVASSPQKAALRSMESMDTFEREARRMVDNYFGQFKAAVQRGRGGRLNLDLDTVDVGTSWTAAEALQLGLVDEIATLSDILDSL